MTAGVVDGDRLVTDGAPVVRERLEAFAGEVMAAAVNHPVQLVNGRLYMRGLLEEGHRKSLEPIVTRLGDDADYQSMQQFLAVSPWDPVAVTRCAAARAAAVIGVRAWVIDDTGFPKDGNRSPGVKRQYSGTLGKIGNCQIGVSVHAVGERGTVPLGWELYLPEEWCADDERRRKAKIPEDIAFRTKPQLAAALATRAAGWDIPAGPVLGDAAYGGNTALRDELNTAGLEYVLSVGPEMTVFSAGTGFTAVERQAGKRGRPPAGVPVPDRPAVPARDLILGLGEKHARTLTFRDGPDERALKSRFVTVRVRSAHHWDQHKGRWDKNPDGAPPREEWLIAEWPKGKSEPIDYWISNLPASTKPARLARLARLRWTIELDYRQLKGRLGLDHYEGRSYLGWYHHTALVTAAHAFLTLERQNPLVPWPA